MERTYIVLILYVQVKNFVKTGARAEACPEDLQAAEATLTHSGRVVASLA